MTLALGPIGQISRSVRNIEQSIDWYKNKVGLSHLYTYGKLSFFDCGRGIVFANAPHLIHRHDDGLEEWMAFFNDLEGRPLAIMCQVKPEAPQR